jgi:hypothetical protein
VSTTISESSLNPLSVCLGNGNSNRLVSLWDIVNAFSLHTLLFHLDTLHFLERSCQKMRAQTHGGVPLPAYELQMAQQMLPAIKVFCDGMRLESSSRAIERIALGTDKEEDDIPDDMKDLIGPIRIDVAEFETEIRHVVDALRDDLGERGYVYVVPGRVKFLTNDHLLGPAVSEKFPKARYDIREAGNCFAVDANTAAIFHMMRVAEHGLRALAYDRRVKVPKGPFDLATWEDMIKELERAENAIQGYPKTHAREAQYRFYHGAMMEVRSFKNVWRNPYMHTRAGLREDDERREAERVMTRVGDFMKLIATRISERKRTSLVWKGKKWTTIEP